MFYKHPHFEEMGKVIFSQVSVRSHLGGEVPHLAKGAVTPSSQRGVPHPADGLYFIWLMGVPIWLTGGLDNNNNNSLFTLVCYT